MQISDNEIYLLIKYIKSVLWRVVKCLSYIEDARCLKVKYKKSFQIDHYNGRVNRLTITKQLYYTQHTEVDVALLKLLLQHTSYYKSYS